MTMRRLGAVLLMLCGTARAEPIVFKMATVAPEGSLYSLEAHTLSRQIEEATGGAVKWKWYFNAVAGDELEQGERIKKGQLDGSASGHMLCEHVAPSVHVARLAGLFQTRTEAFEVMNRLQPLFEKEAHENGFVFLGAFGLGPVVIFSREPMASMADLRKTRFWKWDVDEVGIATSHALGIDVLGTPIYEAARAYEQKRVDGFLTVPSAALAFQWSSQAHYLTDLTESYLWGCILISERSFSRLSIEQQQAIRSVGAAAQTRFEATSQKLDADLLRVFKKKGLAPVRVSDSFRAQFFAAARAARDKVAEKYVSRELLDRVLRILADYRAEHKE